ncbi:MAG: acyl-CoA dehydrogenase family protein [Candidatus Eremiobacteraeota bacterium]|nr:acyl-CoA dehydrogenase family protein [Candidatus Eremiobacteraeota bacterium]
MIAEEQSDLARFQEFSLPTTPPATDFYLVDELLKPEEREVRDRVRAFADREIIPIAADHWERAEFPFEIIPKFRDLGLTGGPIVGYGSPGVSLVAAGLIAQELARGDSSLATCYGVHSGLAMGSVAILGSDEQRERWLPAMARLEKIGAFALTEPTHGSDSIALETSARRDGDSWVLRGKKKWIGNASFADLVVVWARDDDGNVGGFVVEKGTPGFTARVIEGKIAKRAVWQAEITLDDVRIPLENRLERARSFKDTAKVLTATRYAVAWEAIGHAMAAYEYALAYTQERKQFGKPLVSFQLVQDKLVGMLGDIVGMQLMCLRLSQLLDERKATQGMASLAKMLNCRKARRIVSDARDLLGGNGILLEHHVARHFADMEAIFTYEGTDHMQMLVVGKEICGVSAYK